METYGNHAGPLAGRTWYQERDIILKADTSKVKQRKQDNDLEREKDDEHRSPGLTWEVAVIHLSLMYLFLVIYTY